MKPLASFRVLRACLSAAAIPAALVAMSLSAAPLRAETLSDALVAAYRNSSLLDQNRAVLRAADEDLAQAVASLRPVVNFAATAAYSNSMRNDVRTADDLSASLSLAAELVLFDGGIREKNREVAQELVLATRAALVRVEQDVLLSAVRAYVGVRLAIDTVALRRNNVRVIESELRAARDRFALGEVTRTDVAIAEARLAAATSNLAAAEGDLDVARERFKLAVGRAPGELAPPPLVPAPAANVAGAKDIARARHPSLAEAKHRVTVADLSIAIAQAAMGPRVDLRGNLGLVAADRIVGRVDGADFGLSVTLSQPIYQGGADSSRLRQAMAQRDGARAGLHLGVAQIETLVGQAWAEREVARARIDASELQVRAARSAFESVKEEVDFGARTTLDLLNAEQEALDAEAARLGALAAREVADYALLAAMGLMTVEQLKLGVPVYDVEAYHNAVRTAPASRQSKALERIMSTIGN